MSSVINDGVTLMTKMTNPISQSDWSSLGCDRRRLTHEKPHPEIHWDGHVANIWVPDTTGGPQRSPLHAVFDHCPDNGYTILRPAFILFYLDVLVEKKYIFEIVRGYILYPEYRTYLRLEGWE